MVLSAETPEWRPGQDHPGKTARMESGVAVEPWAKLRADPVTTRWQHKEVEPILGVLDLWVAAGVSQGPAFSL